MGKMTVFSPAGDTVVGEWTKDDEASVEIARGKFEAAMADGFGAVAPVADGGSVAVGTFSPDLEEITLLKPIAGG
jgi:hypothetical protein